MKTKIFLLGLLSSLIYSACEDDTIDSIGMGIQPDQDKISVFDTIIQISSAQTVKADSIYAKTINGLLGNFYDPDYGGIKAGYLCQYYPSVGFSDSIQLNDDNTAIDSVHLTLFYTSYFGDSIAPMEVTVYPITKSLNPNNYYTNANPADYCDLNTVWGKKAYTAYDMNVPDSIHNLSTYYKRLSIPLPVEWGQKVYEEYKDRQPATGEYVSFVDLFGSPEKFAEFFPGTYLESSFGTGNLLQVDISEIYLYYKRLTKTADATEDSTYTSMAVLTVTKEMEQLNCFQSTYSDKLLTDEDDTKMYLKTPAGVFSKITIPVPDIIKGMGKRKFNSVKLSIGAYTQQERKYTLPLPGTLTTASYTSKLLLIEPDSAKIFFEEQRVADSQTAFTTTYDNTSQSYHFNNIANLIQNAIEKAPDKPLELLLIPVQVEYTLQSSGYSYSNVDYSTSHYLFPSAVTLKRGGDNLQIKIIASDMNTR
jgi:hypothetical protein